MKMTSRSAGIVFGIFLVLCFCGLLALVVANMNDSQYEEWGEEMVGSRAHPALRDPDLSEQVAREASRSSPEERRHWWDWLKNFLE